MARGDITQKISLEGDAEVKRKLEQLGATGERAFAGLNKGAQGTAPHFQRMEGSSKQLGFAVRNLSFQVNDLFTSLASGAPVMQVFAQQGGQIVQAFQQGGGLSAVIGGVTTSLRNFITPARLAGAAAVTAAGGFAVLLARALDTESSIKQFGAALKGLQQSEALRGGAGQQVVRPGLLPQDIGRVAAELETSARNLRDAGLGIDDARKALLAAIRAGVRPADAERIVRLGRDLNAVFGEGKAEKFIQAVGGGAEPLRKFAAELGITGGGLNNVNAILQALERRFGGIDKTLVSPFQKAMRDLGVAWQDFLTTLAGSAAVTDTLRDLENLARAAQSFGTEFKNVLTGIGQGDFQPLLTSLNNLFVPKEGGEDPFLGLQDAARQAGARFRAAFVVEFTAARTEIEAAFTGLGRWIIETFGPALSEPSIWQGFVSAATAAVNAVMGLLAGLVARANEAARAIAAAFSSADRGVVAQAPIPFNFNSDDAGFFARGGMIRGPGTGTSDSVPLWGSDGEYINTARAVRYWGADLFAALNRLQMPKFAMGGLVGAMNAPLGLVGAPRSRLRAGAVSAAARAASGGRTVHLHIGSDTVKLNAEPMQAEALIAAARRKNMLSAGRKPSWAGGRRYGG